LPEALEWLWKDFDSSTGKGTTDDKSRSPK
jgi:hypothetical protein